MVLRNLFKSKPQPPAQQICVADFGLSDEWRTIAAMLNRTVPLLLSDDPGERVFDFSKCKYFGPSAAAIVYANWLTAREEGRPFRLVLPGDNAPKVKAFLHFSGLEHLV